MFMYHMAYGNFTWWRFHLSSISFALLWLAIAIFVVADKTPISFPLGMGSVRTTYVMLNADTQQ